MKGPAPVKIPKESKDYGEGRHHGVGVSNRKWNPAWSKAGVREKVPESPGEKDRDSGGDRLLHGVAVKEKPVPRLKENPARVVPVAVREWAVDPAEAVLEAVRAVALGVAPVVVKEWAAVPAAGVLGAAARVVVLAVVPAVEGVALAEAVVSSANRY